jgi:hypothetical protein
MVSLMVQRATMLMTSHWRIPQIFATQSIGRLLPTSWQLADCYRDRLCLTPPGVDPGSIVDLLFVAHP